MKHSLTHKHLENEDPYRPPVTFPPVITIASLRLQHLRRDVVWSANCCITVHHASLQQIQDTVLVGTVKLYAET